MVKFIALHHKHNDMLFYLNINVIKMIDGNENTGAIITYELGGHYTSNAAFNVRETLSEVKRMIREVQND